MGLIDKEAMFSIYAWRSVSQPMLTLTEMLLQYLMTQKF